MAIPEQDFPKMPFTFEVKAVNFEAGTIHVKFMPSDSRFTFVEYMVPILATFDPSDMMTYLTQWAPFDKWFAQKMLLEHGDQIMPSA